MIRFLMNFFAIFSAAFAVYVLTGVFVAGVAAGAFVAVYGGLCFADGMNASVKSHTGGN